MEWSTFTVQPQVNLGGGLNRNVRKKKVISNSSSSTYIYIYNYMHAECTIFALDSDSPTLMTNVQISLFVKNLTWAMFVTVPTNVETPTQNRYQNVR